MDIAKRDDAKKRLLKESIIREYLQNRPSSKKDFSWMVHKLKTLAPINIFIGILASIAMVYIAGLGYFIILMLSGIIWITIISGLMPLFVKGK